MARATSFAMREDRSSSTWSQSQAPHSDHDRSEAQERWTRIHQGCTHSTLFSCRFVVLVLTIFQVVLCNRLFRQALTVTTTEEAVFAHTLPEPYRRQGRHFEIAIARSIGIPELRWTARTPFGGGGSAATVQVATAAVESRMANAVVIYRAFNERSGRRFGQPREGRQAIPSSMSPYMPFGLDTPAKIYALWFER